MTYFHRHHFIERICAIIRKQNLWLMFFGAITGVIGGIVVHLLNMTTMFLHKHLFGLPGNGRFSGLDLINPWLCISVPAFGGLCLWLTRRYLGRYFSPKPVDIVKANALYGGKMSLKDSFYVALQTFFSNGFGISLGLESAYTQVGSAFASKIGSIFRMQHSALRILVGCGAAGAISGAFNSTLGGAFYGFEIVIASYTLANVPPVMLAALGGVLITHLMGAAHAPITVAPQAVAYTDYGLICLFALLCSAIGIGVMYLASQLMVVLKKLNVGQGFALILGGATIGTMALITPTILGSGHKELWVGLAGGIGFKFACMLLLLKVLASSISLGVGFRGGLFFASMIVGTVAGIVYFGVVSMLGIHTLSPLLYAVIGVAAVSVTIIGGPLSMMFLALDITDSYTMLPQVLLAVLVSMVTVHKTFGYSFSTWQFHLRGENIQSAFDISWLRKTSVKSMMHLVMRCLDEDKTIQQARCLFSIQCIDVVVLRNEHNEYKGIIYTKDLYNTKLIDTDKVSTIAVQTEAVLFPGMMIKEALRCFNANHTQFMVVVHPDQGRLEIVGTLTKNHALSQYNEFLERQVKEFSGVHLDL